MHPFSALTLGIFVAGYTTARWDLVTRLYELAIFAWDYGVVVSCLSSPFALGPPSGPFDLLLLSEELSCVAMCQHNMTDFVFLRSVSCAPPTDSSYFRFFSLSSYSLWHVWRQESQTWYDQPTIYLMLLPARGIAKLEP